MRLLVITQMADRGDSDLGFFHAWLEKLSYAADKLLVICLQKGDYQLPSNTQVWSLGKERQPVATIVYVWRFWRLLWRLRGQYDAVLVHMNPEYAILGAVPWRLFGRKKVLLWYVHKAVNWRLWLAEKLVTKIFTASPESFRLPSKKLEVVGHGIEVERFASALRPPADSQRIKFLSVGRISPVKDYATLIKGVGEAAVGLIKQYDIVGEPISEPDKGYMEQLKKISSLLNAAVDDKGLQKVLLSFSSAKHDDMPAVYRSHDLFLHASRTGSTDKVVLEALAAGLAVITSSEAFASLAQGELKNVLLTFPAGNHQELAKTIEKICRRDILISNSPAPLGREYVKKYHNLDTLIARLVGYFQS